MANLKGRKIEAMYRLYGVHFGKRCADCPHLLMHVWNKRYYKCEIYGNSHSEATDWRLKWQACGMIEREAVSTARPIMEVIRYDRSIQTPEPILTIPGQITMEELLEV